MRYIVTLLLTATLLLAKWSTAPIDIKEQLIDEYKSFSFMQRENLKSACKLGEPFNLCYSLAAIGWKESMAGKYKVNISDPSCGFFHNNLKTVLSRAGTRDTSFNRNVACQALIDNFQYAAGEAVAELEYWRSVRGKYSWTAVWASYNAGWKYENGKDYAQDIRYRIWFLQKLWR